MRGFEITVKGNVLAKFETVKGEMQLLSYDDPRIHATSTDARTVIMSSRGAGVDLDIAEQDEHQFAAD